jgi:glutathione synthase/RimK-type ligase-like ATP-grasp enzyme
MSRTFLVMDRPGDWSIALPDGVRMITPREYLMEPEIQRQRRARVFNLSRDYSYQSAGYYVSLLAEARGHRPLPSVATLRHLHGRPPVVSAELQQMIQSSLSPLQSEEFTLSVYFARSLAKRHDRLARALYNLFPSPLLRATFVLGRNGNWRLRSLGPIAAREIPENHAEFVNDAAQRWLRRPAEAVPPSTARYSLAILVDPAEAMPPSDEGALKRFIRAAARQKVSAELIEPDDLGSLAEYDALFIRSTTSVENFTFRFARRAVDEGIPVMDDPVSILRCSNKVFMAELFERHQIPAPLTRILYRGATTDALEALGLPLVLKQPDSSFSQGVIKIKTAEEFASTCARLFQTTDLLIAQQYLPTEFDWRIGVLDGQALYACRYYMARGHWQIYKTTVNSRHTVSGKSDTIPIEMAPPAIVATAVRAANLIGDGFYGVDLKEIDGSPLVIEINDNPSIEQGVEDLILKDALYDTVIRSFVRRIETRTASDFQPLIPKL